MASHLWICLLLGVMMVPLGAGLQSVWKVRVDQDKEHMYNIFPNYMFKDSFTSLSILCYAKKPTQLVVSWTFRQVHCMEQMYKGNLKEDIDVLHLELQALKAEKKSRKKMLTTPRGIDNHMSTSKMLLLPRPPQHNRTAGTDSVLSKPPIAFQISANMNYTCHDHNIINLQDESTYPYRRVSFPDGESNPKVETVHRPENHEGEIEQRVVSAWEAGMYHFELIMMPLILNQSYEADVTVEMHGRYGYLTAIDWPLFPYNGVMSFLYLVLSTVWIMTWARSHRFTLKIHVGMGIVAVVGAISHTLVFVQHAAENSKDGGAALIMWFAEVLASMQMSFLNFILMVVSTGYGINTPTLPRHTLILMGFACSVQFVLGVTWTVFTDSTLKLQYDYPTFTKAILWCQVATIVIIAAEIMISTISTLIHLRQRRHAGIKIITFTTFMVSCIITFIVNVVVFVLTMGWMHPCRTNWQLQWLFDSIPHMAAFLLLIVLMVLWRPVDTAQSYAFAPLGMDGLEDSQDEDDEDDEVEVFIKETDKFKLDVL